MAPFLRLGQSLVGQLVWLGPLGRAYPFSRLAYTRELLSVYIIDGTLDLSKLGDLLLNGIVADLTCLGGSQQDAPIVGRGVNKLVVFLKNS